MEICAGEYVPDPDWLPGVMNSMLHLCCASEQLAAELIAGGALGALLRVAQRLVAAQPRADQDACAGRLLAGGLMLVVKAFGRAVPQARAHGQRPQSEQSCGAC